MSELKYGTVTLRRTASYIDFENLEKILGWKAFNDAYIKIRGRMGKGSGIIVSGYSNDFPRICSLNSYIGIANQKDSFGDYDSIYSTGSEETGTLSSRTIYARYVINEETDDWIISITDKNNYENDNKAAVYATLIGTTFDDGQKVIFAPDGTMLYMNDDGTWKESGYKALYDNIGANFDSAITQEIMLFDFFVVNIDTGELKTVSSRLKYSTFYSGKYEPVKFEEKSSGDTYVLVPGARKNSIAVCLKEVITYDVD